MTKDTITRYITEAGRANGVFCRSTNARCPDQSSAMSYRILLFIGLSILLASCRTPMNPPEHPVEPATLSALIMQADKIVVSESLLDDAKVLFSSNDPKDIAEFNDALTVVVPDGWFHCMCIGSPAIRLYRGDTELVRITSHHGQSVRCSLWSSDAMLKNQEKWLQWFDARKMPEPRHEVDEMAANAKQSAATYQTWLAAMPKTLRPVWDQAMKDEISPDFKPLRDAIAREFPDTRQRALNLLAWYGSGSGPWSGFPSYESAAAELLLDIPTSDLVAAVQSDNLTDAQLTGAARFLSGWGFSERRPGDHQTLPVGLKEKLLKHTLAGTDKDNQERAQSAFGK